MRPSSTGSSGDEKAIVQSTVKVHSLHPHATLLWTVFVWVSLLYTHSHHQASYKPDCHGNKPQLSSQKGWNWSLTQPRADSVSHQLVGQKGCQLVYPYPERDRTLGINLLQILASEQNVLGISWSLPYQSLLKQKGAYVSVQVRLAFSLPCLCSAPGITPGHSGEECLGWRWEERNET